MEIRKELLQGVEHSRERMCAAYEFLWSHPETGYREWEAHRYLTEAFERLGYTVQPAGNIPGFYADVDTGRPGPTALVFGELDALLCPSHPAADPGTGAAHACGHCVQAASLLGLAGALKEPGALEGMSGRIRLMAVPAEELIEMKYRRELRQAGVIHYLGGKQEFLYRGLLDGVDMAFMLHTTTDQPLRGGRINYASNGCVIKEGVFRGVASHAGGSPHLGVNALYAATQALSAVNALRETFRDQDHIRVHPILTSGGSSVNIIPDRAELECYVRAADGDSMQDVNRRVNRALAASAAALGAELTLEDQHGYFPRRNDRGLMLLMKEAMEATLDQVCYQEEGWGAGCSDIGDISALMPVVQPYIGGAHGTSHGADYGFEDGPEVCMCAARVYAAALWLLLREDAGRAKEILAAYKPRFAAREEYFRFVDAVSLSGEAVRYAKDGSIHLLER